MSDGVARQAHTATHQYFFAAVVGGVFEDYDIALLHLLSTDAAVVEQTLLAPDTQAVAPAVHQHAVALCKQGRKPLSFNGIDSESQGPESHHQHEGDHQGEHEFQCLLITH